MWKITEKVSDFVQYLVMPFRLILANSIANVMWSWCSIPLATLLNTTYIQESRKHMLSHTHRRKLPI